jgi:hypothetical protein
MTFLFQFINIVEFDYDNDDLALGVVFNFDFDFDCLHDCSFEIRD